ncbi:hypothetical protein Poli38472_004983 [Pythium oligandrum]|uniref:Uncharacterized protein n=1 Tax=Pythium oligandrum TaxID=41045 RepID=A0A8K1CBC1_PYTOL|nr:hypothetical protein Poli38472_004983 [Pythium oligandrum]|eukprot:TMW59914.1 hypothetical protein Poli38472_004983 [Pythium oligandrum]
MEPLKARRSVTGSHGVAASTGDAAVRRAPMRNPSRERLQAELHFLRTETDKMELQVNELKEARRQERARAQDATAVNALVNLSESSWELTLLEERMRRERAEEERVRLECQLDRQLHVISCLKRLMQEQMDMALLFTPSLPPQNSLWSLYGQFVYDLGVAYLMTDEVLDNSDWAKTTTPTSHLDVKTRLHHGIEQVFLELRRQRWMPLTFSQATGELWTSIVNVVRTTNQVLVEFVASEDRIAAQYYHTVCFQGVETKICVSIVVQHFSDVDRDVYVWRFMLTAISGDEDERCTAYGDGTGWDVLEAVASGGTLSRLVTHIHPLSVSDEDGHVGDLTNLGLFAANSALSLIDQRVERSAAIVSS